MRSFRLPLALCLAFALFIPASHLTPAASAQSEIVGEVRSALAQKNFSAAESELNTYKAKQGINGEYLEAYSWLGRAALDDA